MDKKIHRGQGIRHRNNDGGGNKKAPEKTCTSGVRKHHIKKSDGYLHKGIKERVNAITHLSEKHSIMLLCSVLKVYNSINRKPSENFKTIEVNSRIMIAII
eukprot:TRINITY_DN66589_c0_g1_i1.p2 TRINITY_DN66589_c0_g1~~TRINITY_DN66589_c0_g1_i1.p2  ORF type:complete len:101 (+),score=11.72 TRINITY_DN66589_c0_g1_i1:124-426(+)